MARHRLGLLRREELKTQLALSLFLNCALAGALCYLLLSERVKSEARSGDFPGIQPAAPFLPRPEPPPGAFSWAQIESADYRTYIANLRAIGCPEQTIRDIISADVHELYAAKIQNRAERRGTTTLAERTHLEQELQGLRRQEASLISNLLDPSVGNSPSHPAQANDPSSIRRLEPVALPLVFQPADVASLNLTAAQFDAIVQLRQRFLASIGGLNQDPDDPEYRRRWLLHQPAIDQDLRGMIGTRAFQEYQLRAQAKTAEP